MWLWNTHQVLSDKAAAENEEKSTTYKLYENQYELDRQRQLSFDEYYEYEEIINAYDLPTKDYYDLHDLRDNRHPIECYVCHYRRMRKHRQGMLNCDENQSIDSTIPVVRCDGLCAVTKSLTGRGEYMIVRSCLPNCKNVRDVLTSVKFCYGDRCNSATTLSGLLSMKFCVVLATVHVVIWVYTSSC